MKMQKEDVLCLLKTLQSFLQARNIIKTWKNVNKFLPMSGTAMATWLSFPRLQGLT